MEVLDIDVPNKIPEVTEIKTPVYAPFDYPTVPPVKLTELQDPQLVEELADRKRKTRYLPPGDDSDAASEENDQSGSRPLSVETAEIMTPDGDVYLVDFEKGIAERIHRRRNRRNETGSVNSLGMRGPSVPEPRPEAKVTRRGRRRSPSHKSVKVTDRLTAQALPKGVSLKMAGYSG